MHELVMQLFSLLDDESAITVRLALSSLKLCLPSLSLSHHSGLAVRLLLNVVQLRHNSYWLVKVSPSFVLVCHHTGILSMKGADSCFPRQTAREKY